MKIMLCISQLSKGGAERVITNLANYLSNKNYEVILVSVRNRPSEYKIDDKVKLYYLDNNKTKNVIVKVINRIYKLNKYIKETRVDIVLSFLPMPSFLTLLLKKIRKIKVVVSVRNDPKIEYQKMHNFLLMKLLYSFADGFVFQTSDAQKYFSKKIQKKSTIIFNSLNSEFISDLYVGQREKIIVSVGRLVSQKNQLLLIKAFEKIHLKFPEYKLIIYGDGELREELENYIKEKKLANYVLLPGVENNIKEKIYKASLFVLSSNYEGLPNALIEAMALGIPSISTDCPCGGPKTLIKDGYNGILTKVMDVDMLASKMEKVLLNGDLTKKISKNAYKIQDTLKPSIINQKWETYLNKIVNE